jgi:hypothetical protein
MYAEEGREPGFEVVGRVVVLAVVGREKSPSRALG